jgi:hypothetical protein
MKPNLKSYNATSLGFYTTLALTDGLISEIQNISPPDEDGDSLFVDSYKGHWAFVWIKEVDKGLDKGTRGFRVEFNYELGRGGRAHKSIPGIGRLIDVLSSIKEKVDFDCRVALEFGRRLKPKSVIPLPTKYTEFLNMPFDIIQGLHMVKLDGKERKYDVILEAPAKNIITESVFFKYTSGIDKSLADRILREAMTISDHFVSKE